MKPIPSIARIVQVDYAAQLGAILAVLIWVMALGSRLFDPEAADFFRLVAPLTSVAGLALLVWRQRAIGSTFESGSTTEGLVTAKNLMRGRGRITYTYVAAGKTFATSNAISESRFSRALTPGQRITVVFDPQSPNRAFISELYL